MSRKILIYILFFLCHNKGGLFAQRNIDSISGIFEHFPNDTFYINKITRYGNSIKKVNLTDAITVYKIAYEKSLKSNNKYAIAFNAWCLGSTYSLASDFENAFHYITEAKKNAAEIKNKQLLLKIHLATGNIYSFNSQFQKAREVYEECLIMSDELNDNISKATIYNNIGGLIYKGSHMNKENLQVAVSYFIKSIRLIEENNSVSDLPNKYCNLALMYTDLGKPDSAFYFLEKAKVIIDEKKLPDDLITYYDYTARVYADLKDFDNAEKNYFLALEECKKLNNSEWIAEVYIGLSDLNALKNDYRKAHQYLLKYHLLHDSIVNVTNFSKAADIHNKYEREKKEVELNQLKAEQAKNKIFNIALIVISLLLVVSGAMMYSRFKIKSKSEKQLKVQNEIIGQKNKDITDSINYSRKIQDAILPSQKAIAEIFKENFTFYKPKDIISGDFYWCVKSDDLKFFAVADCTGHGVPGALMSMLGTSLLKEIVITKKITRVDEILNELRALVILALDQNSGNRDGMDIALICYDEKNKKLFFSGANNSLIIVKDTQLTELKPDKQPIGIYEHEKGFTLHQVDIEKGTLIYLYSDGFADQFGGIKGKKWISIKSWGENKKKDSFG